MLCARLLLTDCSNLFIENKARGWNLSESHCPWSWLDGNRVWANHILTMLQTFLGLCLSTENSKKVSNRKLGGICLFLADENVTLNANKMTYGGVVSKYSFAWLFSQCLFHCFRQHLHCWLFSFQVNMATIDWNTPLFNACVSGSVDCLNLLLQHGASPHAVCDLASPIHEAAKRGKCQQMCLYANTIFASIVSFKCMGCI